MKELPGPRGGIPHLVEGAAPELRRSPSGEILKAIQMPSKGDMIRRLETSGLFGHSSLSDSLNRRFIDSVAGEFESGESLNTAWTLAMIDMLGGLSPQDLGRSFEAMNMDFDLVIEATTPDKEVADQAKEIRHEMLEAMKRKREQGNQ